MRERREFPNLRRAAEGESCIVCGAEDGTVVLAHRNEGKGMALKVPDFWGLDLCGCCHAEYDQGKTLSREERRAMFNDHYPKQVERWIRKKLLTVA